MRLIEWTRVARDDLRSIDRWLEREASPDFAVATMVAIKDRATFLVDFPHGGRPQSDGTRILRVFNTPYLIRYRIAVTTIAVLRIHHEREDWLVHPL